MEPCHWVNTAELNLSKIDEGMLQPLRDYAGLIKELAGEDGLSLAVFGPVTMGSFEKKRHTVGNALILKRIDLELLRRLSRHGLKLGKSGISAPLIMTPAYIRQSLDTFPLEFLEIQQTQVTLFGQDYFSSLFFQDTDIRVESERELKSIMIGLRQGLLASAGREKFLTGIEADITSRFVRTLRGLLWLKGKKDPRPQADVVLETEKTIEERLPGVTKVLQPSPQRGWEAFKDLYRDVETVGKCFELW